MAIQLTSYGGAGEIGGNAFLLEAPGLRVMLDMGRRFGSAQTGGDPSAFDRRPGFADYFDVFLKPRAHAPVSDLCALDLIPWGDRLSRLYRPDLGGQAGDAPVDYVLLSHAHMDHCGLLGLVRPDVPVVMTPESKATLASLEATGVSGWETDFLDVRARGLERKGDGVAQTRYTGDERGIDRNIVTAPVAQSRWDIQFHAVDHSIQGAAAFTITDGDTKIVYSGDFRQHGLHAEKTRQFLKAAVEPDVLLVEGTRVGHSGKQATDKETDVEAQVRSFVEAHEASGGHPFVAVGYPPRDLDRFVSLHRVARAIGRRLLVSTKQADLLDKLRATGAALPDWRTDPNLAVHVGGSPTFNDPGRIPLVDRTNLARDVLDLAPDAWLDLANRQLETWEFRMLGGRDEKKGGRRLIVDPVRFQDEGVVSSGDVRREPGDYLVGLNLFSMPMLFDVFPDRSKAGGLYIHSMTQPHNDDMEMDRFRLRRWLRAFRLNAPDHEPRRTHVSGHVSEADLDAILDEVRPRRIVPIHTDYPNLTRDRFEMRTGRRGILPQWGVPVALS